MVRNFDQKFGVPIHLICSKIEAKWMILSSTQLLRSIFMNITTQPMLLKNLFSNGAPLSGHEPTEMSMFISAYLRNAYIKP